jgi:hypothetical protein
MAAEKFSFSFKTSDGTPTTPPLRLFGVTAKTTTADLNCLPTSEPPKELPQDSTNAHTEITKQANFVQQSLHTIYTKAKANKVNKTHRSVSPERNWHKNEHSN